MPDWDALTRDELAALARQLFERAAALQERVRALEEELERLRKDPPSGLARAVPSFVKPNKHPKVDKPPRKKRPHGYARKREEPTERVDHHPECCPDCGRRLSGGSLHHVRQVEEIPPIRVRIVEHRIFSGWCGVCKKRVFAQADLSQVAVGRHRMGVGVMSLVSYLRGVARMPKRTIQAFLASFSGLRLSVGEITEILHRVAKAGAGIYAQIQQVVRGSPSVHADETSWRQDGMNGYLWSFSTPKVRYFTIRRTRAHTVPEEVLGPDYKGVIISDFYAGYSYHLGEHQRCWAHFLRDLRDLGQDYADDARLVDWTERVVALYRTARDFRSGRRKERIRARFRFQDALTALGEEHASQNVPQRTLAQRCVRFASELFTFVEYPDVPSHNNPAELSVRPSVIARKISGGTRSENGSKTAAMLMSLFGTWSLQGLDPLTACQQMLTGHPTLQVAAP